MMLLSSFSQTSIICLIIFKCSIFNESNAQRAALDAAAPDKSAHNTLILQAPSKAVARTQQQIFGKTADTLLKDADDDDDGALENASSFPGEHFLSSKSGQRAPAPNVIEVNETAAEIRLEKLPEFKRWTLLPDLDCGRVLSGDQQYIKEKAKNRQFLANESLTDWPVDCSSIRARNYFNTEPGSDAEAQFPIAFARNVYKDYPYIEAELASNYAPQNWYCYAVDDRSPTLFKDRMKALSQCFPNVIVNSFSYRLDSMGHNQTASLFECLKNLAQPDKAWRYILVLQNHDVQLKTNEELVQILKWMNGANDISIRNVGFVEGFINKTVDWSFDALKLIKDGDHRDLIRKKGGSQKIQFAKSYYQSALSRKFIDYILNQLDTTRLMRELDLGACFIDEFMLPSLDSTDELDVPGGYTHECLDRGHAAIQITRFNIYTCNADDSAECVPNPRCRNPQYARHGVCPMSMEDLAYNLKSSHSLFYNKALPEFDLGAVQCWHETMFNRTHLDRGLHRLSPYVYKQLPQVRYQSYKELKRNASITGEKLPRFDCLYRIPVEDKLQMFDADGKSGWRIFNHVRRFVSIAETARYSAHDVDCYGRHSTYHLRNTGGYIIDPRQSSLLLKSRRQQQPPQQQKLNQTTTTSSSSSMFTISAVDTVAALDTRAAANNSSTIADEDDLPDFLENGESVW